jgi:hypothetical protein
MTFIAAFRCSDGGVLLCADREENDNCAKRDVNKIYRILLNSCEIFIAGSGPTNVIEAVQERIHSDLIKAISHESDKKDESDKIDIVAQHRSLINTSLESTYDSYKDDLNYLPMNLVVVVRPYAPGTAPIVYGTEKSKLEPKPEYVSFGTGKFISDYFVDRLKYDCLRFDKPNLMLLAAFIFWEAHNSASFVGPNVDMVYFYGASKTRQELGPDCVKELQAGIPSLSDAIFGWWNGRAKFPKWAA